MNTVVISNVTTEVISYQSQPVVTTKQLAGFYGCKEGSIRENFRANKERFEEGKHFIKLSGKQVFDFAALSGMPTKLFSPDAPTLMLWTAKGAARHAKMLSTEKAWEVFEQLEDAYFKKQSEAPAVDPMQALNDPVTMRSLLLGYSEKVIALESKVLEQAPKVEALDRIATATDGALCPTDAAKMLQVQPKKLIGWLQANKWMYKRAGSRYYVGYQDKIQTGYLEHKEKAIKLADGSDKMTCQVLVTAKGLARLSAIVSKEVAL